MATKSPRVKRHIAERARQETSRDERIDVQGDSALVAHGSVDDVTNAKRILRPSLDTGISPHIRENFHASKSTLASASG